MSDDYQRPKENGSRLRLPAIKWSTLIMVLLTVGIAFQFYLTYRNVSEWEWNRLAQAAVSERVAGDRVTIAANNARVLNELKLQTLNQMLPPSDQQRLLGMLVSRLDEETRRDVLSLKLRALQVIGEQESQALQPQRQPRRQAP